MQLTKNVGTMDRVLRLLIGAALILLTLQGTIGVWGWLGLVLIGTAFVKFCPIYKTFGLKTCQDG